MRTKMWSGVAAAAIAAMLLTGCVHNDRSSGRTRSAAEPANAAAKPVRTARSSPSTRDGMNWAALAYPTGDQRTSAILLEKGMPVEVVLNEEFESIIRVTNLTSETMQDVVVTDEPSSGLRLIKSSPAGTPGANGAKVVSWNLGNLGPSDSKEIRIRATATKEGTVGNCIDVSYNTLLCLTTPVVSPKLALVKTGPAQASKCEPITYEFVVTNTGTGTVRNVTITDPLPSGLTAAGGGRSLTFKAGDLAAGASKSFRAQVSAAAAGKYENKATASASGGMTAESGVVQTTVVQPVLTIKDECTGRAFIGRPIEHKITVCNTGSGSCDNGVVTFNVPANCRVDSVSENGRVSGRTVTWNTGKLAPRACKTYAVRMTPQAAGSFTGTARAQCACADAVTANCTTQVRGIPAILLECVDSPDPVAVGTNTTYTITVTNQGSAPGTGIKIRCELESQEFVSAGGSTRGTSRGNVVEFAPLPSLAPGEKATFRLTVKASAAGDVRFKVGMTSDQFTRPVEETESTNQYQ